MAIIASSSQSEQNQCTMDDFLLIISYSAAVAFEHFLQTHCSHLPQYSSLSAVLFLHCLQLFLFPGLFEIFSAVLLAGVLVVILVLDLFVFSSSSFFFSNSSHLLSSHSSHRKNSHCLNLHGLLCLQS